MSIIIFSLSAFAVWYRVWWNINNQHDPVAAKLFYFPLIVWPFDHDSDNKLSKVCLKLKQYAAQTDSTFWESTNWCKHLQSKFKHYIYQTCQKMKELFYISYHYDLLWLYNLATNSTFTVCGSFVLGTFLPFISSINYLLRKKFFVRQMSLILSLFPLSVR